jgi:mRNA-degrading endonuclease toxin of MazEF toxin-antitoxin module
MPTKSQNNSLQQNKITEFFKNWKDWFSLKPKLDEQNFRLSFKEREIWYCYFGTNIGFEIDGKEEFLRPCLIIKKLSKETCYVIPLTSNLKTGSWYYPSFIQNKHGSYIFSQMKLIDSKRLKYFVERLDENKFLKIKTEFINFFSQ